MKITAIDSCVLTVPTSKQMALEFPSHKLVIAELKTDEGLRGLGYSLVFGGGGAESVLSYLDTRLKPLLIGEDPLAVERLWEKMYRGDRGVRRVGIAGMALSALDIGLWDIAGKAANQPIHKLLGGMGRARVAAYASSINWLDDATVEAEVAAALTAGFREIKVKLGHPLKDAIARARFIRKLAGDDIALYVDANWAYDVDDALIVGRALADLGYGFFEEPIAPHDHAGYRRLARHLPIRLAAGESDYVATEALAMLQERSLGLIQPDVTRSGGITETWRIAELAASFNTAYAPHVGWSGAICVAASLQLAAAAETLRTFECMVYANPLRDSFTHPVVGEGSQLVDGQLMVPQGPGLGIEIDRDMLARHRIA